MVFGNIRNEKEFEFLPESLKKCFDYVRENDVLSYEPGIHEIEGKDFFVNVVAYDTTTVENRFWEAHRVYLDVHIMLEGKEQIDMNFIEHMDQKEFVAADDFLPMDGDKNGHVILEKDDFLVCYPADAHRTAVQVDEPCKVKKAIFKIKI